MERRGAVLGICAGAVSLGLTVGCEKPLYQIVDTPGHVLSLANELVTIETGEALPDGLLEVEIPEHVAARSPLREASVYALHERSLEWLGRYPVSDNRVRFDGEAGASYLIQGEFAELSATYGLMCRLRWRYRWRAEMSVDRVCERILCAAEPVGWQQAANDFADELGGLYGPEEVVEVGGFGESSICDQCTGYIVDEEIVVPSPGCTGGTAQDTACYGDILYSSRLGVSVPNAPNSQIFRMELPGGSPISLTTDSAFSDTLFDVSEDGAKILFRSSGRAAGSGAYTMTPDGEEAVRHDGPPSSLARGRWSRQGSRVFAFNADDPIHIIDTEGGLFDPNPLQISFPGAGESDFGGFDLLPGSKRVIFSRRDQGTGASDLLIGDVSDADEPVVNATATPTANESFPVVSHSEELLAFRVVASSGAESIRVMSLADGELTEQNTIGLDPSEFSNVSRVEFTADDRCLLVTAQVASVDEEIPQNRQEILLIDLTNEIVERITDNAVDEVNAAAVPR